MKYSKFGFFLVTFTSVCVSASDFVRMSPVTDRILMLHFDDGHLDYMGKDQNRFDHIKVYYKALNLTNATKKTSYQLSSADDAQYNNAVQPINLGRKSKGVEFNNIYQGPAEPDAIREHYIYLEFPHALQSGKTYTIDFSGLADNRKKYTFRFDEKSLQSETIHVNQLGFTPTSKKYAYVSHWMGDFNTATHGSGGLNLDDYAGTAFHLVRVADLVSVFSGTIQKRKVKTTPESTSSDYGPDKNFTKADVWECNFSEFQTPGEYKVVVEKIGCSFPFRIDPDVYRQAYYYTSKGLFVQRAGIEKVVEPGWIFPRDQHPDMPDKKFYYDPNKQGNFESVEGFDWSKRVYGIWGWYHDAGDWDSYTSHAAVPALLLALYDMKPENFADGDVSNLYKNDPSATEWTNEGANGVPDLLDEASWLIQCYRRARHALMDQKYGTGGVPGYFGRDSGYKEKPAWEDPRDVAIAGENATNTMNYAGLAAWYAACLNKLAQGTHPDSSMWIQEARDAYAWAATRSPSSKSQAFAASALYRITGEDTFQQAFKARYSNIGEPAWSTPEMNEFANIIYCLLPDDHPNLDLKFRNTARTNLTRRLDTIIVNYANDNRGYRMTMNSGQTNILGSFSTPRTLWSAAAYTFTGQQKYLDAVRAAADYFLGGNEMNMVWMTGVGDRSDKATFHLNSWYSQEFSSMVYVDPIVDGLVPYGTHSNCDWFDQCSWSWIGDEDFSRSTAYPHIDSWPQSETRFQNRHNIPASEFTVHQNQNHAIFTMGFLCDKAGRRFVKERPTVSLNLADNQKWQKDRICRLTATASANTRRVAYYYDWHFIGESTDRANGFAFDWDLSQTTLSATASVLITAVAYDAEGLISRPSDEGDKKMQLAADVSECRLTLLAENGTVSVSPEQAFYAAGTAVTLNAQPAAGYVFAGWAGDLVGKTNPATITIQQNQRIRAIFLPEADLSDNDGDGYQNLLEFALGSGLQDGDSVPFYSIEYLSGGKVALRYKRPFDLQGVEVFVEKTSNLESGWSTVGVVEEYLQSLGSTDDRRGVSSWSGNQPLFFRLKVRKL